LRDIINKLVSGHFHQYQLKRRWLGRAPKKGEQQANSQQRGYVFFDHCLTPLSHGKTGSSVGENTFLWSKCCFVLLPFSRRTRARDPSDSPFFFLPKRQKDAQNALGAVCAS
jgi:hypothetical protein